VRCGADTNQTKSPYFAHDAIATFSLKSLIIKLSTTQHQTIWARKTKSASLDIDCGCSIQCTIFPPWRPWGENATNAQKAKLRQTPTIATISYPMSSPTAAAILFFAVLYFVTEVSCIDPLKCNATEYVRSLGYPTEEHYVTVPDGYILFVQRILPRAPKIGTIVMLPGIMSVPVSIPISIFAIAGVPLGRTWSSRAHFSTCLLMLVMIYGYRIPAARNIPCATPSTCRVTNSFGTGSGPLSPGPLSPSLPPYPLLADRPSSR